MRTRRKLPKTADAATAVVVPSSNESSNVASTDATHKSSEPSPTATATTAVLHKPTKTTINPTKTASDLRKIMEDKSDADRVAAFRESILRAAVEASRTGQTVFAGAPNGEIYPDIGKVFATYSGLKPCQRCKSNKQGVREFILFVVCAWCYF